MFYAGQIFEKRTKPGVLAAKDVFDTNYRRDGSTEPAQYVTAAVAPLETCARAVVENALIPDPVPDFCPLQDRNAFAAIHNLCFSNPGRVGDRVWIFVIPALAVFSTIASAWPRRET